MNDTLMLCMEKIAAAVSIALMAACGVQLFVRLIRVIQDREPADGALCRKNFAPWQALLLCAGAALISRLMLYLLAYGMYRFLDLGTDSFFATLEPLWNHWDARHYIGIAEHGYTAVGDERLQLVFFPLYPLLMRALSMITGGSAFACGMIISLLCSMIAAALVFDLAYMHFGRKAAVLSTAYFLLSPLSVFLGCAYTEALFICLTLAAVCLLRRGHPWLCALCGMLSAFTRMPGVIVCGLLIIAFLGRIPARKADLRAALSCAAQVLIVFCGLFAYWIINWLVTGDPFMYLTYQAENWYQRAGSFWQSTATTVHYFLSGVGESDWLWTWGFQLICMFCAYVLLLFGAGRMPFDLAAYSFVYVAVVLSPTWLLSGARYLYALCTAPMLLARIPAGKTGHALLLTASAVLLAVWTFGYTIALQVL